MPDAAEALKIEVVPWGPAPQAVHEAGAAALEHPAVRAELAGTDHMVLSIAPVAPAVGGDESAPESGLVRTTIYDYTNERTLLVDAPLDGSKPVAVRSTTKQPLPGVAELKTAVEALVRDPELGVELRAGRLEPYRPMPPFVLGEQPDGRVERMIAVGLRSPGSGRVNEIVAVKPTSGAVKRFAAGAPAASLAADAVVWARQRGPAHGRSRDARTGQGHRQPGRPRPLELHRGAPGGLLGHQWLGHRAALRRLPRKARAAPSPRADPQRALRP